MKAKIVFDGHAILSFIMDEGSTEYDARQAVGVEGVYHKRANGLWIVVKP